VDKNQWSNEFGVWVQLVQWNVSQGTGVTGEGKGLCYSNTYPKCPGAKNIKLSISCWVTWLQRLFSAVTSARYVGLNSLLPFLCLIFLPIWTDGEVYVSQGSCAKQAVDIRYCRELRAICSHWLTGSHGMLSASLQLCIHSRQSWDLNNHHVQHRIGIHDLTRYAVPHWQPSKEEGFILPKSKDIMGKIEFQRENYLLTIVNTQLCCW
jgi:hypothetical protein